MPEHQMLLCNYAVAFIDLLGQREEMRAHRILPDDHAEAIALVKRSVGRIAGMHKTFKAFYESFEEGQTLYDTLPPEQQKIFADLHRGELKTQRFSDGLVVFAALADGQDRSPINSVFALLTAAGSLAFTQLAAGYPVRVGIDIGWGVEMEPGEIYGAAMAHAYELESQVAQWPRVVVGTDLIQYLRTMAADRNQTPSAQFRRMIAGKCLNRLAVDIDGLHIVDFAGEALRENADPADIEDIKRALVEADRFVDRQLQHWNACGNAKLVHRYNCLRQYLQNRPDLRHK